MMKNLKNNFLLLVLISVFSFFFGCTTETKEKSEDPNKITVYCDAAIYATIKPLWQLFDSLDTSAEIQLKKASSMDAMVKLLSGEANAVLLPRDYTHYEDSIMKVFAVAPHTKMQYATDALVLFVNVKSEIDTLTAQQVKQYLTNANYSLTDKNKKIKADPKIVINNGASSEIENLQKLITGKEPIKRKLKMFGSVDSVKSYIDANPNDIGIGYLSQIVQESKFRAIAISFLDSNKKYIFPHVVHQTNVAQNLYPYIVKHYIYILDKRQDLTMRFGRFLSTHPAAQKYFNEIGIVPAFAKIQLIGE